MMPIGQYNDFMPRHANQTSFKKGQKFLPNGKPIGWKTPGWHSWNTGKKQWPNGLPDEIKLKIKKAWKGKIPIWLSSFQTPKVTKNCLKCGKPFTCIPSKAKKRQFCSYTCSNGSKPKHSKEILEKIRNTKIQNGVNERSRFYMKNGGAIKARLAQKPPSRFQKQVFKEVKTVYPDAVIEYWINTKHDGVKAVDIFIPSKKLAIECDGYYWHKNREELDRVRQSHIEELGYRVTRIPEKEWAKDNNLFRYI